MDQDEEIIDEMDVDSSTSEPESTGSFSNENSFNNNHNMFKNKTKGYNPFANIRNHNFDNEKLKSQPQNVSQNQEGQSNTKEKVASQAVSKGITALTGGAVHGKVAAAAGQIATKLATSLLGQHRRKIIIGGFVVTLVPIIIIITLIGGSHSNEHLGSNTVTYTISTMEEKELIEQLIDYGYCKDEKHCKDTGILRTYKELKDIYDDFKEPCPPNPGNNNPCGIRVNTALILETVNFYMFSDEAYEIDQVNADEANNMLNFIQNSNSIVQSIIKLAYRSALAVKKLTELDEFVSHLKDLAIAQSEYIREDCQKLIDGKWVNVTNYFYQRSYDKYISYLKYGVTSSHDNYKNNTYRLIKRDTCEGPNDDTIEGYNRGSGGSSSGGAVGDSIGGNGNGDSNSGSNTPIEGIAGDSLGASIVNTALKYVGHPYVYGKKTLCDNWEGNPNCAVDCSGFTKSIMAKFGINIPDGSANQRNAGTNIGTDISRALPGDIICYNGHVAIYMGNGKIVHASNSRDGVKVSNNANYKQIVAIVRVWE